MRSFQDESMTGDYQVIQKTCFMKGHQLKIRSNLSI